MADPEDLEGDTDAFAALQAKRVLEQREAKVKQETEALTAERAAFEGSKATAAKVQRDSIAAAIAKELNVPLDPLLKFTDGSPEAMRELAAQLPKVGVATPPPPPPDSGRSSGTGRTNAQIMDAYNSNPSPENRAAYAAIRGS